MSMSMLMTQSRILFLLAILLPVLSSAAVSTDETCTDIVPVRYRSERISVTDFGGVGDGKTVNTQAFREAVYSIERMRKRDGTELYVPSGVYLTGNFNLTSHMTLFLASGAVIKAIQDTENWPVVDPLPSYGRGREIPGGRYSAFILGNDVHDVIITGENGTIDGQGDVWWNKRSQKTLKYTRPHLIEFMHSTHVIVSNITLQNSPFWNIHPVYCSTFVVHHATILAPRNSPNTDGVDPDSSSNVCIEDSYISTGDDLIAVKSGWDEYGITYNQPSTNITVRRITGSTPFAGVAVGSETSGGVENVKIEHITLHNVAVGVHIKTNVGRGGFIRNITVLDVYMEDAVKQGIKIAGDVGGHPDDGFDPDALPAVSGIVIRNVTGVRVGRAGLIRGIRNAPFTNICLYDINLGGDSSMVRERRSIGRHDHEDWECSDVMGSSFRVSPMPCSELMMGNNMTAEGSCSSYLLGV